MLKRILLAALWLPLAALAQSYPSPTFNNVTVNGTLSAAGGVTLSGLTADAFVYSGTGGLLTSTAATNGQILIGSTGAAPVKATLNGTTNQINVTNGAGSITLSTPQNIDSTATPTFFGVTLNGSTAHGLIVGGGNGVPATYTGAGTSAEVLTSNGSSADPTFQAIPWGKPGAIGATTASSGKFTTLQATSTITGFPGRLLNVQVFTSSGTYTPTTGTNSVIVEVQAAGGGSGGIAATGAGTVSASTGSGSGAYAKVYYTSGFSGVTVTIGAPGTAGAAGGAGGNASATSFGSLISCPGGNGTGAGAASSAGGGLVSGAAPTATPTISGGTTLVSVAGSGTNPSFVLSSTQAFSPPGANSILGLGGADANTVTGGGIAGTGFGSGSAAPINSNSQSAQPGTVGRPAIVIVYEFS